MRALFYALPPRRTHPCRRESDAAPGSRLARPLRMGQATAARAYGVAP